MFLSQRKTLRRLFSDILSFGSSTMQCLLYELLSSGNTELALRVIFLSCKNYDTGLRDALRQSHVMSHISPSGEFIQNLFSDIFLLEREHFTELAFWNIYLQVEHPSRACFAKYFSPAETTIRSVLSEIISGSNMFSACSTGHFSSNGILSRTCSPRYFFPSGKTWRSLLS